MRGLGTGMVCAFTFLTSGCLPSNNRIVQREVVLERAPRDFRSCRANSLHIDHVNDDIWAVEGCGLRAVYDANGSCRTDEDCDAELTEGPAPIRPAKR